MDKMKFRIYEEEALIVDIYYGKFLLKDYIEAKEIISAHPLFNPSFNLAQDFRQAESGISREDIISLVNYMKNKPGLVAPRKAAYLTSEPDQVVATSLFQVHKSDLPIESKIFSTTEAIDHWLGRDLSKYPKLHERLAEVERNSYV